jgi:hypothetical protein
MNSLSEAVRWLWALSIGCQIAVPTVLFLTKDFRKLPLFTACAVLNVLQAALLLALHAMPQSQSPIFREVAWDSEGVILLSQALAATEVLGVALKPYPAIWGLGWRVLALSSCIVLIVVAAASRSGWTYARWFDLNRGYHVIFSTAMVACLLVIRYYAIPVPRVYKLLLGGFCFYSCTEILINTILQALFYRHFAYYEPVWQFATMSSFIVAEGMWLRALRHPLPEVAAPDRKAAASAPARLLEIHAKLRELNDKLARLWKLEAR